MFSLFNKKTDTQYAITFPKNYEYIRKIILKDLYKVMDYYKNANMYLENQNIFIRIINGIDVSLDNSDFSFLREIESYYKFNLKQMGVVSNNNIGFIIDDMSTYDVGFILIDNTGYNDIFELLDNWENGRPVKVLYNDITDLHYNLPNKVISTNDTPVLGIDFKALFMMYKKWYEYRQSNNLSTETYLFVHKYIFTSIIESQVDISVFNRIVNKVLDLDIIEDVDFHPIMVSDHTKKVDDIVDFYIERILDNKMYYDEILYNIRTFVSESTLDVLVNDSITFNKQTSWVYFYIRLKYILFLVTVNKKSGSQMDKDLISELRIFVKQIKRNSIISSIDDSDFKKNIYNTLKDIESIVGKR